ncbi:MAG: nucleotidyltransferase family protein, partial [Anaerolineales bacterium]
MLLRAALLPTAQAQAAWTEWRRRQSLDGIDHVAFYLLPELYHNLAGQPAAADLGRLRGTSRKTWYDNQLLSEQFNLAANTLRAAGIVPLVTGGLAWLARRPERLARRSADDTALVVPPDRVLAAWAALRAAGWRPAMEGADPTVTFPIWPRAHIQAGYAGRPIALAWRPFPIGAWPEAEREIWRTASSGQVAGVEVNLP